MSTPGFATDTGLHYDQIIDPDADTSGARLARLVGHDKRVLDLGCATGALARVLVGWGCAVVGVEYDAAAAKIAEAVAERVIVGDLERLDLEVELGDDRFDVIVAGDVLEHLREPALLLQRLPRLLSPGGYLVLSVPNAAHASVRLALLHGALPRSDRGLLDRTHVQFLDRRGLLALLHEGAWTTVHLEATLLAAQDSEVPFPRDALTEQVLPALQDDAEALVYQYVALAVPGGEDEPSGLPALVQRLSQPDRPEWDVARELARLRSEVTEHVEELKLGGMAAVDAELHAQRLLDRASAARLHVEAELREAERRNKRLRRRSRQRLAAVRQETADLVAEAEARADRHRSELDAIHTSKLWRAATAYRALVARAQARR